MADESHAEDDSPNNEVAPHYKEDFLDILESSLSENLSQEDRQVVSRVFAQITSGPLPSAAEMQKYKDVDPELPRLIFDMAQTEQKHRHAMEGQEQEKAYEAVHKNQEDRRKAVSQGQILGFVVAVVVLGLSAFMAWLGFETFALVLAGIDVVGLAAVFVSSYRSSRGAADDIDTGSTESAE